MNKRKLKYVFFRVSKAVGLLYLSRHFTRRGLRILCYHAFSNGDEVLFRPKLFMRCSSFEARLRMLKTGGYPVLTFDAAFAGLENGKLPDRATVITIDDGFAGVYSCAVEFLSRFSYPATIYVTTYYCVKQNPVFRLLIQYVFWKTKRTGLCLPAISGSFSGDFSLVDPGEKYRVMWEIIRWGEEKCDEEQRTALARRVAELLQVDVDSTYHRRIMSVMNYDEIRSAASRGMDIQLHTHRHRFPADNPAEALRELEENRCVLQPLAGKCLQDFCYPSGEWSHHHWPILQAAGVRSATTCQPGLNYPGTPKFALRRFLDSEDIAPLEFEVEISGYGEMLRKIRRSLRVFGRCQNERV